MRSPQVSPLKTVSTVIIPAFLKKYRHFSAFYKAEQASEKLHHEMMVDARIFCRIKPVEKMLLFLIKKYEERNRGDRSIADPKPRAKRKLSMANGPSPKRFQPDQ